MVKLTKKLRISLTVMAFILGIGTAFAQYQAERESDNPDAVQFDCQSLLSPSCGSEISIIYNGDSDVEADAGVYNLQYQD